MNAKWFGSVSDKQRTAFLGDCYSRLRGANRHDIGFGRVWARQVLPRVKKNGVYLVFEDQKLAYVGESADIQERLAELGSIHNHPLPRHIVERHYRGLWRRRRTMDPGKFRTAVRTKAHAWMQKHMKVAYLELPLGRAELEDYIVPRLNKKRRYNKPARRGTECDC